MKFQLLSHAMYLGVCVGTDTDVNACIIKRRYIVKRICNVWCIRFTKLLSKIDFVFHILMLQICLLVCAMNQMKSS